MSEENSTEIKATDLSGTIKYDGPVKYVESSNLYPFSIELKGKEKENGEKDKDLNISNPFDVPDDENPEMKELKKGIEEFGVMIPLLVRRTNDGKYELLSGYRRKKAVDSINRERKKNSEEEMKLPVIEVPDCDDDKAIIILTTSNTHRKKISLLEQIKACGYTYRAKCHQGKKSQDDKSTAELVGEIFNVSPSTVERYSKLLNLNDGLLKIIASEDNQQAHFRDNKGKLKLSRRAGEILATTLNQSQQDIVLQFLQDDNNSITIPLASRIKKKFASNPGLTLSELKEVVRTSKASDKAGSIPRHEIKKIAFDDLQLYFPNETNQGIIDRVHSFLDKWQQAGRPENFEIQVLPSNL